MIPLLLLTLFPALHATELWVADKNLPVSASDYPVLNMINARINNPAFTNQKPTEVANSLKMLKLEHELMLEVCCREGIRKFELDNCAFLPEYKLATKNHIPYPRSEPLSFKRCIGDITSYLRYKNCLQHLKNDEQDTLRYSKWKARINRLDHCLNTTYNKTLQCCCLKGKRD